MKCEAKVRSFMTLGQGHTACKAEAVMQVVEKATLHTMSLCTTCGAAFKRLNQAEIEDFTFTKSSQEPADAQT